MKYTGECVNIVSKSIPINCKLDELMDKLQKTKKLKYKGQQLYSKINEIEVRLSNNDTLIKQGLMSMCCLLETKEKE